MTRRLLRWVALVAAAALLAGCAPVAKQNAVRRIARAVNTVGVHSGTITVTTRSLTTAAPGLRLPAAATAEPASLQFVIDRGARRAALLAPPSAAARIGISAGDSFPALVLFDGDRVYVRAPDGNLIGARPWLMVDLQGLGVVGTPTTDQLAKPRTVGDLAVVSPVQVLDLALGVLTGSMQRATATSYDARTSIEKEYRERHLDASDADDFVDLLKSFAVKDDINPITVSLDNALTLRRVAVDFVGKPEYGVKFATRFAVELDAAATTIDTSVLAVPKASDVVEVSTLGDVRAAIDEWTTPEVQS